MSALTAPRNTKGEKFETRPALQYEEARESLTEAVDAGVCVQGTVILQFYLYNYSSFA